MSRVPTAAQTELTAPPAKALVRTLSVAGNSCVQCGSGEIRPSTHRNALDALLACVFLTPFRCRSCHARFYRVWRPVVRRPPDAARAPLLVMPARQMAPEIEVPVKPQQSEPVRLKEISAPAPIPFVRPVSSQEPAVVLIQASDLSIGKLLRRLLERRGYTVIETAAEEKMDQVSLLVADLSADVPRFADVDAIAQAQPALKVLLLVGDTGENSTLPERYVTLQKPFALDTFVETVERLLK